MPVYRLQAGGTSSISPSPLMPPSNSEKTCGVYHDWMSLDAIGNSIARIEIDVGRPV